MEAEVASSSTSKEDSSGDSKLNNGSLVVTANTSSIKQQNCHINESSLSTAADSISMMETNAVSINKSGGALPKLIADNKTATTNSQSDDTTTTTTTTTGVGAVSTDGQYFFEDEVFRIDKKGRVKFGLVMETSGDEELDGVLNKGEVRVVWYSKGNDSVHSESSLGLADRTLMPGDVVRRLVPGKETQRGYCRDINMRADVKVLGTKCVITNVNAERLACVADWQSDSAVCLDSWVGSIKGVEKKAIIRAANGCRIEISSNDFYNFEDHSSLFSPHVFYAGNTVVGRLPPAEDIKILTPDIPLNANRKGKSLLRAFTIESVYTDSVWVHWQCKALSDETNLQSISLQPHPCVSGEDLKRLKRLNLFESCMLQLNDRNFLRYAFFDTIMKKSDWNNEQNLKFKLLLQQQREENEKIFAKPPATVSDGGVSAGAAGVVTDCNGGAGGGNCSSLHHHYEKFKKKLSLGLDEKSANKLKRSIFKSDKFGNSSNKDKAQENALNRNPASPTSRDDNNDWISTDDDDDDDDGDDDGGGDNAEDDDDKVVDGVDEGKRHCDFVKSLKHLNTAEDNVSTTTTISTCSSPSPRSSPKHLTKPQIKKKARKTFKKTYFKESENVFNPKVGDELITEAILVYSTATVVWQDGTIESNISSTQLYPIHHLDNHEFFPGDFVISGTEDSDVSYRDYGVIQTVDHEGRIAHVKWYTTYTSADEPKPTYKGASEVSVYDLKDHPDFQYRPGTMVIRVANFVGKDANCTAGQIIDNYMDGRVKVWWVNDHISMCWPQDLFEVGHYDQGDWGHESEDSWETESENSEFGGGGSGSCSLKLSISESHILSNIERARVAIARLEEIFKISPNLQNIDVMGKLLTVYKGCRYFDRLLNTSFFHEDNFMGLIERVRRVGNQTIRDRVQDQKNRLFNDGLQAAITSPNSKQQHQQHYQYSAIVAVNSCGQKPPPHQSTQQLQSFSGLASSKEYAPKVLFNISSTPFKCSGSNHAANANTQLNIPSSNVKRRCSPVAAARQSPVKKSDDVPTEEENCKEYNCDNTTTTTTTTPGEATTVNFVLPQFEISPNKSKQYNAEKHLLLNSAMLNIEKAFEKTSHLKTFIDTTTTTTNNTTTNGINNTSTSEDDSGNFSRHAYCDCSSASCTSSSDLTNIDTTNNSLTKTNDNQKSVSCSSIELPEDAAPELVCVRLCTLLKDQLVNCIDEIRKKYYNEVEHNFSDDADEDDVVDDQQDVETMDTVIDIENHQNHCDKQSIVSNGEENSDKVVLESPGKGGKQHLESSAKGLKVTNGNAETTASVACSKEKQNNECFQILSTAPKTHKFHLTTFHPHNTQQYYKAVQKEHRMLKNSLPPGVWVRSFEDRMDLLSVMIEGPKKTPYEDGMFFFDIQLGREYPKSPPLCHYVSYCSDRLNPNLYEDGKVCVSLLGTWTGTDTEVWGPKSTLLQVIVSIQGLILVPEPYFNEAGYEKQKGSQQGQENSRMYNEMVMIKMVQATTKLIVKPPEIFRQEILCHFKQHGWEMYERIKGWMELSKENHKTNLDNKKYAEDEQQLSLKYTYPDFPLVPASRGFCLTIAGLLEHFKQKLSTLENTSE